MIFGLYEPARMGRVLHPDALYRTHARLLVVILVIQIDDFDLCPVDPKRDPPISCDRQTPDALTIAGESR